MALGMSSAATTRSSKRNTMVAVVSWMKEKKQKAIKHRNEGHKAKLNAQCTRGTSKKETMGDVSTFNFSLFLLNCSMVWNLEVQLYYIRKTWREVCVMYSIRSFKGRTRAMTNDDTRKQ